MHTSNLIDERYQIGELIGKGMMGPVHMGFDNLKKRDVAIKVLDASLAKEQPALIMRFIREAEALHALNHPNIVQYLDRIQDGDTHYLIMEYVEGGSLRDLMNRGQRMTIDQVLDISVGLVDALVRAHRLGIIHRDLKPENIMLDLDGSPRLTDFGISHYTSKDTLSQEGSITGTLGYIPPEIFQGEIPDERADIWSFGIILFEMLAGYKPFKSSTPAEEIKLVLSSSPPDLGEIRPDVPTDFVWLIEWSLVRDRTNRISSFRLLGAGLEAIGKGEEVPFSIIKPSPLIQSSQLPEQVTSFVGRHREIEAITDLISDQSNRIITLIGPGGVGKTRLAQQVAGMVSDQFHGGILFVDLAPISDPDMVLGRIARTWGLKETHAQSLVEEMREALGSERTMIVLDNFEQVIQSAMIVSTMIQEIPNLQILVTSREPLNIYGEHEYPIPSLKIPESDDALPLQTLGELESIALFIERAAAAQPSFKLTDENAGDLVNICIQLDGLPLAIELAAARIKVFSPRYLCQMLTQSIDSLDSGPRDIAPRHKTLRAAIDWSYQLLNQTEKQIFEEFSIFSGGCSLEAIETVYSERSEANLFSTVESLIQKSLVVHKEGLYGEPRFILLETIRKYAWERLKARGDQEDLQRLHANYFVRIAEQGNIGLKGAKQDHWSTLLRMEYDNLRRALEWAFDSENVQIGLRLVSALAEFWFYDGPISDLEKWVSIAHNILDGAPPAIQARVLIAAGMMAFVQGEHDTGRQWCTQALEISQTENIRTILPWAYLWLSALGTGNPDYYQEGIVQAEKAINIFLELDDKLGLAWAYNQLGEQSRLSGNYERAKIAYEKSLETSRKIGNKRREAISLVNLTYVALHQGDDKTAETYSIEGLRLMYDLKLKYHSAITLCMLAGPTVALGDPVRAAKLLGASDGIFERMNVKLQPADKVEIEPYIQMVGDQLDVETFESAWRTGKQFNFEEAIQFAVKSSYQD